MVNKAAKATSDSSGHNYNSKAKLDKFITYLLFATLQQDLIAAQLIKFYFLIYSL
jgi:hypothetical protein